MGSKIVKVEDVMKIVGIQSYIDALALDSEKLVYQGYDREKISATCRFSFDDKIITIKIDKESNIKTMHCSCEKEYCAHIALAVMYLLSHEEVLQALIEDLNSAYDPNFNAYLMEQLGLSHETKTPLFFDISLKYYSEFVYELQLKIGVDKKYVLKKQLEKFLECYRTGEGTVEFGKNFTYDPKYYFFNEKEQMILDFLETYVDAQMNQYRSYYGYYSMINAIYLSGKMLDHFLTLLQNRMVTIEEGYYQQVYDGIEMDSPVAIFLKEVAGRVEVQMDYTDLQPLTKDWSYVKDHHHIYYLGKESGKFLALLLGSQKKKLWFEQEDLPTFSNQLLPKLKQLDQHLQMDDTLSKTFVDLPLAIKYYFSKEKERIIAEVKICYQDEERNLFDSNNQFKNIYVVRNREQEKQALEELYQYHFVREKDHFYLEKEADVIAFLETNLMKLSQIYDVYVAKNLKEMKVYQKTTVRTSFGIGRDNILNYSFSIDYVDPKEMNQLLESIRLKKKYYKLKTGDYLSLEQSQLSEFAEFIELFDLSKKELSLGQGELPKYQSVLLDQLSEEYGFISLQESVKELLEKFQHYQNLEISFSDEERLIIRDYQEVGIQWMMTLSKCGFGGILADEMGLGKSLQTISYIKLKQKENPDSKFLIVVPTSLIYNWESEFQKFGKEISYQIVNDTKEKRSELVRNSTASVWVTTYGLLRQDIELYETVHFDTCIIDEAQMIKNVQTETTRTVKRVIADTKFALTGTPIENSVLELWSIFDFILPGLLPNLPHFRSFYSIKNMEEDPDRLKMLNQMISPFILRRKKKEVLKDLPDKIENHILVELSEEQKKIYFAQLKKIKKEIDEVIAQDGVQKSQILILSLLTKLRQICIHPSLFLENYQGNSSKFDTLLDILKQVTLSGHKVLVFSQFPSALRLLEYFLTEANLTYYYLDGGTKSKERMRLVESFNQDATNLFLISLKAGGTGLNLTSADIVVHLDPWWNPQVENQATDRTHRIGQKNVVEVIKLVAKGTIEEKIIELQKKKKNLSDQVIEGENRDQIVLSKLSEAELLELFQFS